MGELRELRKKIDTLLQKTRRDRQFHRDRGKLGMIEAAACSIREQAFLDALSCFPKPHSPTDEPAINPVPKRPHGGVAVVAAPKRRITVAQSTRRLVLKDHQ